MMEFAAVHALQLVVFLIKIFLFRRNALLGFLMVWIDITGGLSGKGNFSSGDVYGHH